MLNKNYYVLIDEILAERNWRYIQSFKSLLDSWDGTTRQEDFGCYWYEATKSCTSLDEIIFAQSHLIKGICNTAQAWESAQCCCKFMLQFVRGYPIKVAAFSKKFFHLDLQRGAVVSGTSNHVSGISVSGWALPFA